MLENGATVEGKIEETRTTLSLTGGQEFTFHVNEDVDAGELDLVAVDTRSFTLSVNDESLYAYSGTPASHRVHVISLPALKRGAVSVIFDTDFYTPTVKLLLVSKPLLDSDMLLALMCNMLVLGMYLAIIFQSVAMYLRKRSESYLLYLALLAASSALTDILYMNYPIPSLAIWDTLHMGYLHALSQTLCLLFCVRITKIEFPGKLNRSFPFIIVAAVELMVFILNLISYNARTVFIQMIFLLAIGVLIYGAANKRPYARLLLVGISVMEGMLGYFALTNSGMFKPLLFMYYIHLPELCYLIFVSFCSYAVASVFAKKFSQADDLVVELEKTNAGLDATVEARTGELVRANAELKAEQDRKHSMMTNIFHDLRSPLFSASGFAEMTHGATDEDNENLDSIRDQLAYLSHLTENLFLVAKLEEGKITFAEMEVDLQELCNVVVTEMLPFAAEKGVTVTLEGTGRALVTGDGFRMRQAIDNLLSNAVRYSPEHGAAGIRLECCEDTVRVNVWDRGSGVPPEDIPHLFTRYYRSKERKASEGSGLGLCIAKELVEAQHGRIEVESTVGKGSVFTIVMPAIGFTDQYH